MPRIVVHHLDIVAAREREPDALLGVMRPVPTPRPDAVQRLWVAGLYTPVADIVLDGDPAACESAWRLTQNVDAPWTANPRAGALAKDARSSMVGDLFFVDGAARVAVPAGFQDVDLPLRRG